jgi:hypothetical protein
VFAGAAAVEHADTKSLHGRRIQDAEVKNAPPRKSHHADLVMLERICG